MPKYRNKAPTFNAVQWNAMGDHPAVRLPVSYETKSVYAGRNLTGKGLLQNHGGTSVVNPGDFIVTTDNGGYSVIPGVAFSALYEIAP